MQVMMQGVTHLRKLLEQRADSLKTDGKVLQLLMRKVTDGKYRRVHAPYIISPPIPPEWKHEDESLPTEPKNCNINRI